MSEKKNYDKSLLWWKTAEDDYDIAVELMKLSKYAASCFHFQQALGKAFKAVYIRYDIDSWGHSIYKLWSELQNKNHALYEKLKNTSDDVKIIDRYYIPTRYPDSLPDITPMEAFTKKDAADAQQICKNIMDIVIEEFK